MTVVIGNPMRMLLCRPRGGLNDMLSQIEKCCRYAEVTGRVVVVDTRFGDSSFYDDFDTYFVSRQRRLILSARELKEAFDQATTFPPCLQGQVTSYRGIWTEQQDGYVEKKTGTPLTFDFARNYSEELLVHQQYGRLPFAAAAFLRLHLQPAVTKELLTRVSKIGGPFLGVHVRHTDYRSDYHRLLGQLARATSERLFLSTDNRKVLDEFRAALPSKQIYSFSEDLSTDGRPIHLRPPSMGTVFRRNSDAILDVLLLALSVRIVSADIINGRNGRTKSGYSVLASELFKQKRYLSELLGHAVKIGLD